MFNTITKNEDPGHFQCLRMMWVAVTSSRMHRAGGPQEHVTEGHRNRREGFLPAEPWLWKAARYPVWSKEPVARFAAGRRPDPGCSRWPAGGSRAAQRSKLAGRSLVP